MFENPCHRLVFPVVFFVCVFLCVCLLCFFFRLVLVCSALFCLFVCLFGSDLGLALMLVWFCFALLACLFVWFD